MTGQEAHARWLSVRWPDMSAEGIARDWKVLSERAKAAWDAVAQPEAGSARIRAAVEAHEPADGITQWYVDDHCIDVDAKEFWTVITTALDQP